MEDYIKTNLKVETLKKTGASGGGCISHGDTFQTENGLIFVKQNSKTGADIMFNGEFEGLKEIGKTNTVKVPEPLLVGKIKTKHFIVLEYLDMSELADYSTSLGESIAKMHLHNINSSNERVDKFGFHTTTCCGFIPLENEWCDDWVTFYTNQRLLPQIRMLEEKKGERELSELWSKLVLTIPKLFKNIVIKPSLLHGDLWNGNIAEIKTESVIFYPGAFYGHHEFDLGIAGMFGGFNDEFYKAYHRLIPKAEGFAKRHQLYQLFHHLNHWNHFGCGYKQSSLSIMRSLTQ